MSANAGMLSDEFDITVKHSDLNAMWNVLCKIIMLLANEIFRKKWFKNFDSVFTKVSLKFHSIKKLYHASKLAEFLAAREVNIRFAIDRRMKSFEMNKSYTIKSVLECSFCKVVLNHLVVDDELILEPGLVKSKVDSIMEGWTRKRGVVANVSNVWSCQYWLLDYVFNEVFSGIMCSVELSKLLNVISNLPDNKAAGLSEINREIEKYTKQRFPITFADKGKGRLQTPAETPKQIQLLT
ncbi:hypothetical protein G9A89_005477 [Geosiphon pyriformis]|nr:hypothetical protein G9A89_005477 [Geosiphon pyriformis]